MYSCSSLVRSSCSVLVLPAHERSLAIGPASRKISPTATCCQWLSVALQSLTLMWTDPAKVALSSSAISVQLVARSYHYPRLESRGNNVDVEYGRLISKEGASQGPRAVVARSHQHVDSIRTAYCRALIAHHNQTPQLQSEGYQRQHKAP